MGDGLCRTMTGVLNLPPRDCVARAVASEKTGRAGGVSGWADPSPGQIFLKSFQPSLKRPAELVLTHVQILFPLPPAGPIIIWGALQTDLWGRNICCRSLWALGECALHRFCTGRNRLASNSLSEALVFSYRAGPGPSKETPPPQKISVAPVSGSFPCQFGARGYGDFTGGL